MRFIKLGLISLVFFSLLITVISFFFPSRVRLSKATDIHAPKDKLMRELQDASNWAHWYPGGDTLAPYLEAGKVKGISTGPGTALVMTGSTDSSVRAEFSGTRSRKTETGWNMLTGPDPGTVTVQWYVDIHLRWYPWEKFSSLLLEKRFGPLMEQGLSRLKAVLEK